MRGMIPGPLNMWGSLSVDNMLFKLIAVGSIALNLLLGSVLGWRYVQGAPAYFISGCGGAGLVQPEELGELVVADYAAEWMAQRYTFMPDTIKRVHVVVLANIHASLHDDFKAKAQKEERLVKEYQMTSQATILNTKVVERTVDHAVVVVDGMHAVMVGSTPTRYEPFQTTLLVAPWKRQGRKVGLIVIGVKNAPSVRVTS